MMEHEGGIDTAREWAYKVRPLLENEAGMQGRRGKRVILVVVQVQEAYIERKIGGDKEAPNVFT